MTENQVTIAIDAKVMHEMWRHGVTWRAISWAAKYVFPLLAGDSVEDGRLFVQSLVDNERADHIVYNTVASGNTVGQVRIAARLVAAYAILYYTSDPVAR